MTKGAFHIPLVNVSLANGFQQLLTSASGKGVCDLAQQQVLIQGKPTLPSALLFCVGTWPC